MSALIEKLKMADRKRLMWALALIAVNSLFVTGTIQIILNVAAFLIAIWILLILRREAAEREAERG